MNELKKFDWEMKKRNFKEKVSAKKEKVKKWCEEHKEVVIPLALSAGVSILKITGKCITNAKKERILEEEREMKDCSIYSRQDGMYYHTKRKMTTEERLEFERLKSEGYKPGEILRAMNLI